MTATDATELPPVDERLVIEEGDTQKVIEVVEEDGKRFKQTTVYNVVREEVKMPSRVLARRSWAKFGKSARAPPGPEPMTTSISDEVFIEFTAAREAEAAEQRKQEEQRQKAQQMSVPYRLPVALRQEKTEEEMPKRPQTGAYRAPRTRNGAASAFDEEQPSLQITNLPPWTTDDDLRDLCNAIAPVRRVFLAKDKRTGDAKGFAYVDFNMRQDAATALEKLDGHRYGPSVLSCEWAKPRRK
ncbi:eukaryotic translation initiation factor 3 subunit G [Salpingoeca rosetta]|uniref:Eukaryotic translation initiation factor 3 subunit G n=1 Tax=Salpingoeca rosetta (strain ATCC 50818 / BSB-021) TaxID=946362 RepID=F2U1Y2_SALR5|nr:eukaryotic translation initiation factor 3 subunit G [Salpingoeca rosetta]EGD81634.1 eukaryotic translation initiation factor 3 subunit G [Salpingoeca rosetta]|eukprot:XP_004996838.1 eukaryotic translation initiation factor 3 subunit G [Salpingoeca rosetta]